MFWLLFSAPTLSYHQGTTQWLSLGSGLMINEFV